MGFNLATVLRESTIAHPGRPLMHFGEHTFDYRLVDEISGRVAAGLQDLGLRRGDKVVVQLPNVPQFLFAYFGILKAGLVMVPVNPLLRAGELAYHLTDSDAVLLVTFESFADEAAKATAEVDVPTYVVNLPGSVARPEGMRSFDELCAAENTGEITAVDAEDTAVVLYTSGTTGKPKGAELTHFELFMACTVGAERFGFNKDDVGVGVLPLFHVFGLSTVLNSTIRFGGSLVLIPRFEAGPVLDAIERHRCTVFSGVPTMYFALLGANLAERDLSSLRAGISGGAAMPEEVLRGFEQQVPNIVVLEGYGLSETAAVATFNVSAAERKIGSIGKPLWGIELKIFDEDDNELPPGPEHIGEIVIRGHNVMKGYYKRPETTEAALRGGWFRTGDLGYRDEDGFFFVVDRKKDLIIRGGFNVYPREVEEVLYAHPAVREAAVIGKPDARLGEEIVAVVAFQPDIRPDAAELIAFTRERLAPYKCPREIRVLDELPKGPSGKILKKVLREA
ncbi:long-chain fatty acid--CoA ligase [Saccharopolyspora sp. K220]|uniref:long-chain-fatty-acid--CoA ligase n=1 Tax=Saccharopolyspora soli TaxID=2926618 RepID=UPI001F572D93|nr:long-chain fatty acid--CoA ligase [Saccharopolyspora soli]MCI2418338.1 long-chain fatty acid--CoA ligase [Saccharopolyspora soli]